MNARRVARSTREVAALVYSPPSTRPTPQLLWHVLIVLSTWQLSAHRPARLHTVSTGVVLSVTSSQLHLRISSRRPKLVFGQRCSSARAASSPHVHAVGSRTAPSSRFVRFSVGLTGCPIISKLDDRRVPIICHWKRWKKWKKWERRMRRKKKKRWKKVEEVEDMCACLSRSHMKGLPDTSGVRLPGVCAATALRVQRPKTSNQDSRRRQGESRPQDPRPIFT